VLTLEGSYGKYVGLGFFHEGGELWQFGTRLVSDLAPLYPRRFGIVLGNGVGTEGGDSAFVAHAGMGQDCP
jgi:hypothetical protein